MAGGPNKTSRATPPGFHSSVQRAGSTSSASSPPQLPIGSSLSSTSNNAMTAEVFIPTCSQAQNSIASSYHYSLSPIGQPPSFDSKMTSSNQVNDSERGSKNIGIGGGAAILMRRLPRSTSHEALRSMLLFAKDFIDADFVSNEYTEDANFQTAVAYFQTFAAAEEARAMLDGKPNTANEANMIVEIVGGGSLGRRNTGDSTATRGIANSVSPVGSTGQLTRQSSRFNGTFQSMEKMSPPNGVNVSNGDYTTADASHFQTLFSPKSPMGNSLNERPRVTGKSVIDQDVIDEETGEILKDPVAYAKNGHSVSLPMPRRSTNTQVPVSRFAGLSLSTNISSPPMQNFASPRSAVNAQTPASAMSPTIGSMGPNAGYQLANQHYHRHNYPPVNPADQNPPCNTLYVGNLPIDTSEDELKAMFSKQRGYKRLCFRTKQNGPMCFVEFEDVSFATKALNELYGVSLHNSVKGGIRLSFSKNPLGVRTGQPGSMNPSTPLTPQGPMSTANGLGGLQGQAFTTASGPPPGLSAPPGLSMPMGISSGGMTTLTSPLNGSMLNGGFGSSGLGIGGNGMGTLRAVPLGGGMSGGTAGTGLGGMNGAYPDYMMGR